MTIDEMFALWYSEYPRHEARKDGLKAWRKLQPSDALFSEIMAAVALFKTTKWLDKDVQYIPLPATFIRGERWTDEVIYVREVETREERIARKNRETAKLFNRGAFDTTGDSDGPGCDTGASGALLRSPFRPE